MSTEHLPCPLNHDWHIFDIDGTELYTKATHHGGNCWVDFVKRGDYVIGALDYHHKKCANAAMLTNYTTIGSFAAAILIPPLGIPAASGSVTSQLYTNAKAAGYQNAYLDLVQFLVGEKQKAESRNDYIDVPVVNIHRLKAKVVDRYLMRKTAKPIMPSGNIPDKYKTDLKQGDRYRIEFTAGFKTSRLPNGKDYYEFHSSSEES